MKGIKSFIFIIVQLFFFQATYIYAEATLDGTMNPDTTGMIFDKNNFEIKSEYGKIKGTNLFHSFSKFSINEGEIATFTGADSIKNIITRVTGKSTSWINGELRSSIPNANFFLLNPYGVMFGENASISVDGSFYVSSADYLQMKDGNIFSVQSQEPVLSVESPAAFGFLDSTNGKISIAGYSNQANLEFAKGQTFSAVGGDIEIKNSMIMAPAGKVNLATINSAGKYIIDESEFEESETTVKGQINIYDNSTITVWGEETGDIFISSEKFWVKNSVIEAISEVHSSGLIDIHSDRVYFSQGAQIRCENISLPTSKKVCSIKTIDGKKGVYIRASQLVSFTDNSEIITQSVSYGEIQPGLNAGDVYIQSKKIIFEGNSGINSRTINAGKGGNVSIKAFEDVIFSESTIFSDTNYGDAGSIFFDAKNILFTNGSGPGTQTTGQGKGGMISLIAQESIKFQGKDSTITTYSSSMEDDAGQAGDAYIEAKMLSFEKGGGIYANTFGKGDAGNIEMNVSQLQITSGSFISSSSLAPENGGLAGMITIKSQDSINLLHNSEITTEAVNTAIPEDKTDIERDSLNGKIVIQAKKSIYLLDSKISSSVLGGLGNGGDIEIDPEFVIMNKSKIIAQAYEGNGGNIHIVCDHFIQSSDSLVSASSKFGLDGNIKIEAPDIDISSGFVMPTTFMDATRWLKTPCKLRSGEIVSRLVVSRRDGLPLSVNEWQISPPFKFFRFDSELSLLRKGHLEASLFEEEN